MDNTAIWAHEYFSGINAWNFRIEGNFLKYDVYESKLIRKGVRHTYVSHKRKKLCFSSDNQECWFYSGKTIVWVIQHDCMGAEEYNFLKREAENDTGKGNQNSKRRAENSRNTFDKVH